MLDNAQDLGSGRVSDTMPIEVDAVFEAPWFEGSAPWPWPIAEEEPFDWIRIDAGATCRTVGSFLARLVTDNSITFERGTALMLKEILRQPELAMPGGLRITIDQADPVVPGCCCGLETWREWVELVASGTGTAPWLGHDPWPTAEVVGRHVRVWQDVGSSNDRGGPVIEMETSALLTALHRVQNDMCGFFDRVRDWISDREPTYSAMVTQHFDRVFAIRAPIDV